VVSDGWSTATYEENNKKFEAPPLPEQGFYTFELVGKSEDKPVKDEWQNAEGTKKEAWFHFQVVDDPDFEGYKVSQKYTISLNEKSNFIKVVEALINRSLGPRERVGMESDPDNNVVGLMGRRMQAVLSISTDENGVDWGKLSGMIAVQPKGTRRRTPKPAEPVAEEAATDEVPF
jgi:hypothetical protein